MAVYVLDSLLFVLVRDVLSIAFHAFALYCLYKGLRASDQLASLPATRATSMRMAFS